MPPPPNKKRKLPPSSSSASTPIQKRSKNSAKTAKASKPLPPSTSRSKKAAAPATRRAVDPSALSWQTVDEDEFGGLQVIENVGVVKDDGGRVKFLVNGDNAASTSASSAGAQGEAGDEFEGFESDGRDGDGDGVDQPVADEFDVNGATKAKTTKEKKHADQEEKRKRQKPDGVERLNGNEHGNAFSLLTDAKEDDEIEVDVSDWLPLKLSSSMMTAVSKLGFSTPTQIQEQAIPQILQGGDVIGKAETGSGKTLAFGIPIVEKWLELHGEDDERIEDGSEDDSSGGEEDTEAKGPMALLLSPTRELAKQISDHIKALCAPLLAGPYIATITGGLSIQKQQRQLTRADIVIATPGRLWEVLDGDAKLQEAFTRIRFLVVDEADRLLKAGQFKEVQDIIGALNRVDPEAGDEEDSDDEHAAEMERQTLIFSATFDQSLQVKLAGNRKKKAQGKEEEGTMGYLMKCLRLKKEAKFVDVNPVTQMATGLREGLIECGAMEKDLYLYTVLVLNPNRRTLIFTNSISSVRRITPLLQNLNLNAHPLHSQMIQKARLRSLERFTSSNSNTPAPANKGSILVATDVAARGLDIPAIDQVVHYHVPRAADTYVHRSGRTARASSSGVSIILCAPDEVLPTRRLAGKVHAEATQGQSKKEIQSLPVDRKIAQRLKPRVDLAKKLADAVLAKEKANSSDQWLRSAAEDLGVEYDSDEFDDAGSAMARGGRGGGRKRKEKEASGMTKMEMKILRAELREELGRRVNLGVSERYITGGRVDVGRLLRERERGMVEGVFLGGEGLGLEF